MAVFLAIAYSIVLIVYFSWVIHSWIAFRSLSTGSDRSTHPADWPDVTVLVPVRDEAHHVQALVRDVLDQTYPADHCEILLIDDHSKPSLNKILSGLEMDAPNLRMIELGGAHQGKKAALDEGIRRASGEWILTTDADTRRSSRWIESIITHAMHRDRAALAGPVIISPNESLLGRVQQLEQAVLLSLSATGIEGGNLPLCSGANLAFKKELFERVGGYRGNEEIASGDDVFLMQKFQLDSPDQCGFILDKEAVVSTSAEERYEHYIRQRARWAGKNQAVGNRRLIAMAILPYVANASILAGLICWSFGLMSGLVLLTGIVLKAIFESLWVQTVFNRLSDRPPMTVFDSFKDALIYPFFAIWTLLGVALARNRTQYWKGRRIEGR